MSSTTEQIKERLSIVDVVSSYIKLERAGANFRARCPFHNEKTPSFFVSPPRNSYYCFGCGAKGDIFTFVEQFEGIDFSGALKVLADRAGVEIKKENPQVRSEREQLFAVMAEATTFFEKNLESNNVAKKYLLERGLKQETIKKWRLGFARDAWSDLLQHGLQKKFTLSVLEKAGLIKPSEKKAGEFYDRFRSRILFPLFDPSGRVVAFSGRIFGKEDDAKYLNSPETPLFDKSRLLYGFHEAKLAIRQRDYSIMVEGQMDLLMAHQSGYTNVVATSGTAVTAMHLESLKKLSSRLIIAYDGDKAGISASERAWQTALAMGMEVKICRFPRGLDPADMLRDNPRGFAEALKSSRHIIDVTLDDILDQKLDHRTVGRRIKEKILPYIASLGSTIEQAHYISTIGSRANIPENALRDDLEKIKEGFVSTPQDARENVPKKDPIIRKLFALLYWFESTAAPLAEALFKDISRIVGTDRANMLQKDHEKNKQELLFEADVTFEKGSRLAEEQAELLRRLEEEALKDQFASTMRELQKAERDKDAESIVTLLKKCQDISYKLRTISKQQIQL